MPTRNVVLTDHQEQLIGRLVGSGRYRNASEVLREGLRLIEQRDAREAARLEALRRAADIGFADLAAGRCRELAGGEIAGAIEDLGHRLGERGGDPIR